MQCVQHQLSQQSPTCCIHCIGSICSHINEQGNNPSQHIHHHGSKYTKCSILVPTTKSKYPTSQTWNISPPIMPLPLDIHRSHPKRKAPNLLHQKIIKSCTNWNAKHKKLDRKVITCIFSCQNIHSWNNIHNKCQTHLAIHTSKVIPGESHIINICNM